LTIKRGGALIRKNEREIVVVASRIHRITWVGVEKLGRAVESGPAGKSRVSTEVGGKGPPQRFGFRGKRHEREVK